VTMNHRVPYNSINYLSRYLKIISFSRRTVSTELVIICILLFTWYTLRIRNCEQGQLCRYSDGLRAGRPGFDHREDNLLHYTAFRPALKPHPPSHPMSIGSSFLGCKAAGAWCSTLTITSIPDTSSWRGA
jgi:hypothetical protein